MTQLTKGMYEGRFKSASNLFGLNDRQMRAGDSKLTHNSGWYNKLGEKLGWGDLSIYDIQRNSHELENEELFIVLSERYSFWDLPSHLDPYAHGVDYVAKHAQYVIAKNQLYCSNHIGNMEDGVWVWSGLRFKVLKPDDVKALMTAEKTAA